MKEFVREDFLFSLCGLNCGLCTMKIGEYCPGCGGGCGNQGCAIARCAMEKTGISYCFECKEYPCSRYEGKDDYDSFITYRNRRKDMDCMKQCGPKVYHAIQTEKIDILQKLLTEYNDGRKKTLYTLAVNLLELEDLRNIMKQLEKEDTTCTIKENAQKVSALLHETATANCIELRLRKKK